MARCLRCLEELASCTRWATLTTKHTVSDFSVGGSLGAVLTRTMPRCVALTQRMSAGSFVHDPESDRRVGRRFVTPGWTDWIGATQISTIGATERRYLTQSTLQAVQWMRAFYPPARGTHENCPSRGAERLSTQPHLLCDCFPCILRFREQGAWRSTLRSSGGRCYPGCSTSCIRPVAACLPLTGPDVCSDQSANNTKTRCSFPWTAFRWQGPNICRRH
jgi:hypothetical protein